MSNDPAAALALAGLAVPDDELDELAAIYPVIRAGVELLYAPEFSHTDPYLVPTISLEIPK